MIIHLIASMRKLDEDLPILHRISEILYENSHSLAMNWFDAADDRMGKQSVQEDSLDWVRIVNENIKDIHRSDALIVEGSRFNYSQGFQTALALRQNKPVLNLCKISAPERDWPDKRFVSGVSHPLFVSKLYKNEGELEEIITEFLNKFRYSPEEVTIKLTRETKAYLDELVRTSGKTKSELIEEIITREARQ